MLEGKIIADRSVSVTIRATDNFSTTVDQYKTKMGEAETKTREMGSTSDSTKSNMDKLTGAVKGFVAGIAVREVINFAENLNAAGVEARDSAIRFEALASQIGDSAQLMRDLREATLNVVDDTTLQQGATQLLQMGLAETNEEVTKLIELAIKLKRPTESASEAVNSFGLMLANQSVMRLDNFGISSGKVRERIAQLQEQFQGMQRDEAFKLAVMEIGGESLDRLGVAADVAGTALNRLQTRLENLQSEIATNFATGVEGLIGITEIALGMHPEQQRQAQEAANLFAADFQMALDAALSDPNLTGADPTFVNDFVQRAIRLAQENPDLAADATALRDEVLAQFGVFHPEAALGPGGGLEEMSGQINALAQITQYTVANNALARETLTLQSQQADELADQEAAQERVNRLYTDANRFIDNGLTLWSEMTARAREQVGLHDQLAGGLALMAQQAEGIDFGRFATPEQADTLARLAEQAEATVKQMEALDKVNDQLFTDAELQFARDQADAIGTMADEAERAAAALENIRLSDIFGQQGGGVAGELSDMLIAQLRDSGATEEQIAAAQRQLDLASGRETAGSLALAEQIVPELATLVDDPELLATMTTKLTEILVKAAVQGIDTNDPEFLTMLQTETGAAIEGGEESVGGFDPDAFLTNFTELNTQASDFQASINTFLTDISAAQDPVSAVETAMSQISTYATTFADRINDLTGKVNKVRVQLEVSASGDGAQWLESQIRSNGGIVPGALPGGA